MGPAFLGTGVGDVLQDFAYPSFAGDIRPGAGAALEFISEFVNREHAVVFGSSLGENAYCGPLPLGNSLFNGDFG